MTTRVVGLIGFGRMGSAFGHHLADAHRVIVVDPDPQRCRLAESIGCSVSPDVAALLGEGPDAVVLSLPSEVAFRDVVAELAHRRVARPPLVIDTSTLGLDTKNEGRTRLETVGMTLLDAPVSGTGAQARRGDLVVYASGPETAIDDAMPVLESFARSVHRVGPFGTATKVKFLANILVGAHNVAAAEVVALAERAGLDPAAILPVLIDGAGQSRMLEVRGPAMASRDYGDGAAMSIYLKDLTLIRAFVADLDGFTPVLDVVSKLYSEAQAMGLEAAEAAAVHVVYDHHHTEPTPEENHEPTSTPDP